MRFITFFGVPKAPQMYLLCNWVCAKLIRSKEGAGKPICIEDAAVRNPGIPIPFINAHGYLSLFVPSDHGNSTGEISNEIPCILPLCVRFQLHFLSCSYCRFCFSLNSTTDVARFLPFWKKKKKKCLCSDAQNI